MTGENGCHGEGKSQSAYTGQTLFHTDEVLHNLILDVIGQKDATVGVTLPPLTSQPRTPAQELRGLDEPHEWALGRVGVPMTAGAALTRDDQWFHDTQPGAAGTMLGYKESMLIRDGALYVGSTEGVVSKFVVDTQSTALHLKKECHTNSGGVSGTLPFGTPMALGHEAFAMAAIDGPTGWQLVVGTRRHLHLLDPVTLAVSASQDIPWELARPRHLKVGNVIPDSIHPGPEIVFCSRNGGLAFYSPSLVPIWEWPELGIVDFQIEGSTVTILSQRGVVARVEIIAGATAPEARLLAASKPVPLPGEYGNVHCQGFPIDLERMGVDNTGTGGALTTEFVSVWLNDGDGGALRKHAGSQLGLTPYVQNLGRITDIATTNQPPGYNRGHDTGGDHMLALSGTTLSLFDQAGLLRGRKKLSLRQDPNNMMSVLDHAAGNHAHALVVGELHEPLGSSFSYSDEVVVATHSGALLWLHVEELMASTGAADPLPSPAFDAVPGAAVQPRTNRNLSAMWAVSRTSYDQDLHCLDRRGAYWRVAHSTPASGISFITNSNVAMDAKGWDDVDNRTLAGLPQAFGKGSAFSPVNVSNLDVREFGAINVVKTRPWAPRDSAKVFYEGNPPFFLPNNWLRDSVNTGIFMGFAMQKNGGAIVARPSLGSGTKEVWYWSQRGAAPGTVGDWGNLLEAYRLDTLTDEVTGYWGSTGEFDVGGQSPCPHHELRSFTTQVEVMNQQAVCAVELPGSQSLVVVLGCPGGKVRVLQPGSMRVDESTYHASGPAPQSSADYGYGGSALAVRPEVGDTLSIWFGTVEHPCARAGNPSPTGTLDDGAVATGAVHRLTWSAASGVSHATSTVLRPGKLGLPRGGYGVAGLAIGNIIGGAQSPDEVVIGTVGGEILIMDENLGQVLWRANVPGSAGFYNSIRIEDLDGDAQNELYVSGSFGIWRFNP